MRSKITLLVAGFALITAACTSSAAEPLPTTEPPMTSSTSTTTSAPTTTSNAPTTTTTTLPAVEVFGTLNGLEPGTDSPEGVLAVKIDNHPNARPHTGLDAADVVYEMPVEAGLTRFIALFDRHDLEKVGPVRSIRPTDFSVVNPLDVPLQVSGGSWWILRKAKATDTKYLVDTANGTYRDTSRRAPHNLYADTGDIRSHIESTRSWGAADPGNLFTFGEAPVPSAEATQITIPFSQQPASGWTWSGSSYLHSYGDQEHGTVQPDGSVAQVDTDVLVVMYARKYTAAPSDPSHGKAVPAMDLTGDGDALIFYDGGVVEANWVRERSGDITRLLHDDGSEVILPPGRVWISLVPTSESVVWE